MKSWGLDSSPPARYCLPCSHHQFWWYTPSTPPRAKPGSLPKDPIVRKMNRTGEVSFQEKNKPWDTTKVSIFSRIPFIKKYLEGYAVCWNGIFCGISSETIFTLRSSNAPGPNQLKLVFDPPFSPYSLRRHPGEYLLRTGVWMGAPFRISWANTDTYPPGMNGEFGMSRVWKDLFQAKKNARRLKSGSISSVLEFITHWGCTGSSKVYQIPSTKLTYPTWGKGKSSTQKCLFEGIC